MQRNQRWIRIIVALVVAGLQLAACGQAPEASEGATKSARVEPIAGADISQVILTADAARRLDLKTALVEAVKAGGKQQKAIPYAAVLYDAHGETWAYTNPTPLTFVRQHISVERIDGDQALLTESPAVGTKVVTVGAAELYGAEFEFEEE